MTLRQVEDLKQLARLLELNDELDRLTEQEIETKLKAKINVRVIDLEDERKYMYAAEQLKSYVQAKTKKVSATSVTSKDKTIYELTLENPSDINKVHELYNQYVANQKSQDEYKNLSSDDKTKFDETYKAREDIIEGRKVIVLTFKTKQDADNFLNQLRRQGIKFTVVDRSQKTDEEDTARLSPAKRF